MREHMGHREANIQSANRKWIIVGCLVNGSRFLWKIILMTLSQTSPC